MVFTSDHERSKKLSSSLKKAKNERERAKERKDGGREEEDFHVDG